MCSLVCYSCCLSAAWDSNKIPVEPTTLKSAEVHHVIVMVELEILTVMLVLGGSCRCFCRYYGLPKCLLLSGIISVPCEISIETNVNIDEVTFELS